LPVALPSQLVVGRRWIALVAFALIGIVTMQLGLLRLNGGIGRALEQEAALQRENAALSIENSEMAASDRVQSRALGIGMELVPAGALRFLWASPQLDPARGAAALTSTARSATTASEPAAGGGAQTNGPSESPSGPEGSATSTASAAASSEPAGPASEQGGGPASERGGGTSGGPGSGAQEPSSTPPASSAPGGGGAAEAGPAGGTQPQSTG
jgi:cell division protein FtsL